MLRGLILVAQHTRVLGGAGPDNRHDSPRVADVLLDATRWRAEVTGIARIDGHGGTSAAGPRALAADKIGGRAHAALARLTA
ncbi:hypothetical protein KRMM14A1004_29250 [Krasilnikovia sp. MM14-A1004]